jgi:hypothetical protein
MSLVVWHGMFKVELGSIPSSRSEAEAYRGARPMGGITANPHPSIRLSPLGMLVTLLSSDRTCPGRQGCPPNQANLETLNTLCCTCDVWINRGATMIGRFSRLSQPSHKLCQSPEVLELDQAPFIIRSFSWKTRSQTMIFRLMKVSGQRYFHELPSGAS